MTNPATPTLWDKVFSFEQFSNRAVDLLHGATGWLGAHAINRHNQWLHPVSVRLGNTTPVNPLHGVACGLAFALVDHAARFAFSKMIKDPQVLNKPITTLVRMALSISVTALIMAPVLHISIPLATALIATSILGNLILMGIAKCYEDLVAGAPALPPQRPPITDRKVISLTDL